MAKTAKAQQLKSWQDVDSALMSYSKISANLSYFSTTVTNLTAQQKELGEKITAFVEAHTADLGPNKQKSLDCGQVSMRQTTSVVIADEQATLKYLHDNRLLTCYKPACKIIKSGLKALAPDALAAAGVEIIVEDKVSFKPIPQSPNCQVQFH